MVEYSDDANERVEIAEWMVVCLLGVLRDNPFPATFSATVEMSATLWHRFTPAEYVIHHAREFGEPSPRLMEARAISAFLEGNIADGLFLSAALSLTPLYALPDTDKRPWQYP